MREGLTTVDGEISDDGPDAVFVRATLVVPGADDAAFESQRTMTVRADDGRQVDVSFDRLVVVRPERELAGPWREVRGHVTRPPGSLHEDGQVRVRGTWLAPGDRVRVIGRAQEHGGVPATGDVRAAPTGGVTHLEAVAIGVGPEAAKDADDARERWLRAFQAGRARPHRSSSARLLAAAGGCAIATGGLIAHEIAWGWGTLGLAVATAYWAVMLMWWASPTTPFPGGAPRPTTAGDTEAWALTLMSIVLGVPVVAILFVVADHPGERNGVGAMVSALFAVVSAWGAWKGVLHAPRAVPGPQTHLPTSASRRWVVLLGLIAIVGAAIAIAPQITGDGPLS